MGKKTDKRAIDLMSHTFSLGRTLGVSDREMAKAAMVAVVVVAGKQGDPDGFLKTLGELIPELAKGL